MIACLDVAYGRTAAVAACVLCSRWSDGEPAGEVVRRLARVEPYEPGSFSRRELPCLLAVLGELSRLPGVVVVDGYVWLGPGRAGLGAHLHAALGGVVPVVGVAKSWFRGAPALEVVRGRSAAPLYVTAAGIPPGEAAAHVRAMHGAFRIPTLLRRADALARGCGPPD